MGFFCANFFNLVRKSTKLDMGDFLPGLSVENKGNLSISPSYKSTIILMYNRAPTSFILEIINKTQNDNYYVGCQFIPLWRQLDNIVV